MNLSDLPVVDRAEVRPSWLSKYEEEPLEPELPIIDPHHHISDAHWGGYFADHLLNDVRSGHNIISTVFVQCGFGYRDAGPNELRPVGETEKVVAIANIANSQQAKTKVCAGIVGFADLALGDEIDGVLAAQVEAGQGFFRGIRCAAAAHEAFRYGILTPPPLHLYMDPQFRRGFSKLSTFGLTFDSWAYHTQLDELYELAKCFPQTDVVVDHIGVPLGVGPHTDKKQEVFAEWTRSMKRLSGLPNVYVKLGGLGMSVLGFDFHLRSNPPSSRELAEAWGPYIETCIDIFGVSRCMFESNFPVDKGTCSYQVLWNTFKRIAAAMSADEKEQLFRKTAASVYRL
jgi:L-fuconolactonase